MIKEKPFDPTKEIESICTWIKNYFVENRANQL